MESQKCFENYPWRIVITANLVSLLIYFIGGFLIYQIGLVWLIFYSGYILFLEIKLLKSHCVNCYYFGKTCFSGKGRLSNLFFKRGDPKKFVGLKITCLDIIPDFLISIVPVIAGIFILVKKFDWLILFLAVALLWLGFMGSGLIRTKLACKHCRQRELGCPAQKLFNKNKKA